MRPRAVGGYEPDDKEQHELSELWHLSRTACSLELAKVYNTARIREIRITWVVDAFLREHAGEPNVSRKWIYAWTERNIGRIYQPNE